MTFYCVLVGTTDQPLYEAHLTSTRAPPSAPTIASPAQSSFSVFGAGAGVGPPPSAATGGRSSVGYGPSKGRHVQQLIAHAALDTVEDVQWTNGYMCAHGHRAVDADPRRYLKSIERFHEWNVSAWVTPGGASAVQRRAAEAPRRQDDPLARRQGRRSDPALSSRDMCVDVMLLTFVHDALSEPPTRPAVNIALTESQGRPTSRRCSTRSTSSTRLSRAWRSMHASVRPPRSTSRHPVTADHPPLAAAPPDRAPAAWPGVYSAPAADPPLAPRPPRRSSAR